MRHLIPSREAEYQGLERVWPSVQQFAPRKDRSSWWLVAAGVVLILLFTFGPRSF